MCEYTEDNLIDNLVHVYSEEECRLICLDNEECQFITYFNASAKPVPNICCIFKTCDNVLPSENCVYACSLTCYSKKNKSLLKIYIVVLSVSSLSRFSLVIEDHIQLEESVSLLLHPRGPVRCLREAVSVSGRVVTNSQD